MTIISSAGGNASEEPTPMTGRSDRTLLARLRHLYGDVFALVYLGVCAALTVWAIVVSAGDNEDASFAGVIPVLATAPGSLVGLALPGGIPTFAFAVVMGALINAGVIGWCSRRLRGGPAH
ncbi:SCO4225 family membrane protein [Streptomyces sp. NPDC096105]|uniref:SCO4225 family membrane protein n=2 Tax=unclassified Streptomyces TaxID=2593676 RepID=UPI00382B0B8F